MKILDIALKDLTRSFRSAFAVGMMLVAPLLLTGLIYIAFGGKSGGDVSITAIQVGVVNADQHPGDSLLKDSLGASIRSLFFDDSVKSWISASDYPDETAARAALDEQKIGVAVIIPQDFSAQFVSEQKNANIAQVLIISDPTLTIGPVVVENMVVSMLDGFSGGGVAIETLINRQQANDLQTAPANVPVWVEQYTTWYINFQHDLFHNPLKAALKLVSIASPSGGQTGTVDPIQQMVGLTMTGQMIFFTFFTGANAMMTILREAEEGTLARMFTTPTSRTAILTGKFLAVFFTVLIQGLVMMLAGHYAFGVNWGQTGPAALALTGQVMAASGLGVLLISFVRSTRQGGPVLGGGLTVLGMLGGLFTANLPSAMPAAFTQLANFTPQGWVLKIWRMVLNGQPANELWPPFLVLIGISLLMFAIGALNFRKRYA